jgi:hypothetical protein
MARALPPPPEDFCNDEPQLKLVPTAEDLLAVWSKLPKRRKSNTVWSMNKVLPEALAFVEAEKTAGSAAWANARGSHFVALHAWCYERVYKTTLSMSGVDRVNAGYMAGRMLRIDFNDDGAAMMGYLRWAWNEEEQREWAARTDAGRHAAAPLSWYLLFASRDRLNRFRHASREREHESGVRMVAARR